MNKLVFALVMMAGLHFVRVASFNLTIRPDHVRVSDTRSPYEARSFSYTCSADVALAGCQFRWWDDFDAKTAGPLLELSQGSQSQADPAHLNDKEYNKITGYSYSGRGLGAGDCGVSLEVEGYKEWMVACRVRTESGGWMYAWADLYAYGHYAPLSSTLTPREAVVLPGGEARYMMKAGEPLHTCIFRLPGPPGKLYFPTSDSKGRHLYLGAGLERGECGLHLTDISEADNGPVRSWILSRTLKSDTRFTALVVARRPTAPTLSLFYTGSNVTATCEVQESRPVANLSWVLDGAVLRADVITHATAQDEWRWPWMTGTIKQTLTLQLQPQHNGKDLKCVVSHVTLAQPLEEQRTIAFTGPTTTTTASTATCATPSATSSTTTTTASTATCATPSTNPSTTTTTASTATCATPSTNPSTAPGPNCLGTNYLDLLCRQYRERPSQHGNTSCPNDELHEYRIREAAARTAEIEEGTAKIKQEAAKSSAKTEDARASASQLDVEAARSHARAKEAWAQNAEEELQFERERRTKSLQHSQSPQSPQG